MVTFLAKNLSVNPSRLKGARYGALFDVIALPPFKMCRKTVGAPVPMMLITYCRSLAVPYRFADAHGAFQEVKTFRRDILMQTGMRCFQNDTPRESLAEDGAAGAWIGTWGGP